MGHRFQGSARHQRDWHGRCKPAPVLSWLLGPHVDSKAYIAEHGHYEWRVFWRTAIGWCGSPTDPMWYPIAPSRNARCSRLGLAECQT